MNDAIRRGVDPFGDYELLQRVGSGSYGEVYKARDLRNGEFAAVKIVKLETGDNFAAIQQEILVLRDCVHQNIIAYSGSYLKRDRLWIVMEYCSGGSLQDIYQMTGPLTELQIAFICRETLCGLKYLHHRGKVHRDVKGANILLTHSGDVKLADFGIAAQITATIGKRMSFIGSPYWMAPEVVNVANNSGYGSECDIWAVGITAIELAELKPPYFDLQPYQVLTMMTKSSYKIPKLKEKKKWSLTFSNFVKNCLTKNPKKRPSPHKLLTTDAFVSGALSSRLTRELLDRVNHPERVYPTAPEMPQQAAQQPPYDGQFQIGVEQENKNNGRLVFTALSPRVPRPPHQARFIDFAVATTPPSSSSASSSSSECINSEECDDDVFNNSQRSKHEEAGGEQQSYHSERTLLASQTAGDDTLQESVFEKDYQQQVDESEERVPSRNGAEEVRRVRKRPKQLRGLLPRAERPISCASEQPGTPSKANRLLARIDESFRNRWLKLRSKSTSMVNVPIQVLGVAGAGDPVYSHGSPWASRHHNHQPFQSRPMTCCFGMVPTPQVTMGACFVTVLHRASIRVNCCAQWFHPANRKQYMVIGAEQGIFALDLNDMTSEEESMIQLHERRCTWLYLVKDTITALQGKTPYLYRHEILQLFQQELITQKLVKSLDKLPQKLKPKALLSTLRMPETRDCYQCNVDQSITDGNLYLCCAVPNAVLLFRWYDPLSRFVWLKRVELDKLSTPYTGPQHPHKPFNLIFGSMATNSDYPMVCIGISRALTSPVGTAQELLHELRNKPQKDKLELQLVDFNDTRGDNRLLGDLMSAGLFGDDVSSDDEGPTAASPRSATGSLRTTIWRWREKLENVVALKQIDRDTLFIAYDNQIVITDFNGAEKITTLRQTCFAFDFRLEYALPLSDSVLAFHKHGVQAKSFFNGAITQELHDPSKLYQLVGHDSLVVLKTTTKQCHSPEEGSTEDICVLTGHVNTMTPP